MSSTCMDIEVSLFTPNQCNIEMKLTHTGALHTHWHRNRMSWVCCYLCLWKCTCVRLRYLQICCI